PPGSVLGFHSAGQKLPGDFFVLFRIASQEKVLVLLIAVLERKTGRIGNVSTPKQVVSQLKGSSFVARLGDLFPEGLPFFFLFGIVEMFLMAFLPPQLDPLISKGTLIVFQPHRETFRSRRSGRRRRLAFERQILELLLDFGI